MRQIVQLAPTLNVDRAIAAHVVCDRLTDRGFPFSPSASRMSSRRLFCLCRDSYIDTMTHSSSASLHFPISASSKLTTITFLAWLAIAKNRLCCDLGQSYLAHVNGSRDGDRHRTLKHLSFFQFIQSFVDEDVICGAVRIVLASRPSKDPPVT